MENPDEKIGGDYDDEKSEILRYNIIQMLKREYPDADVDNIELNFYVFGSSDFTFHITDFEEKDGKLVYKNGKLPEMKKVESEEETPDEKEAEEKPEEKPEEKEEEKNPENEPESKK